MKKIYKLALRAIEKRQSTAKGSLDKVYQMGHMDGYLDGFREARRLAMEIEYDASGDSEEYYAIMDLGESEIRGVPCGAV